MLKTVKLDVEKTDLNWMLKTVKLDVEKTVKLVLKRLELDVEDCQTGC